MLPVPRAVCRTVPHRRSGPVLLWALLLLLPEMAGAFGLGIHPTTVEVGLEPGGRHRQVLTIGNLHREKSLALTIGLADWSLDENQQLELFPPGSTPRTAASWVRFSPSALKLAPGESQRVVVEVQVPVKTSGPGDYRFGVLVSPVLPPPEERRKAPSGVWNKVQVSSLFYVTLPPASAKASVVDARFERSPKGEPELHFAVRNDGNSHARLSGEVRLLDEGGRKVLQQPVKRVVLEGQTGQVRAPLHQGYRDLPAGRYRADFALEAYEGSVPVEMASTPVLELPLLELPATAPSPSGEEASEEPAASESEAEASEEAEAETSEEAGAETSEEAEAEPGSESNEEGRIPRLES